MSSVERALVRQLRSIAIPSLPSMTLEVTRQRPWASSLFVGTRFTLLCAVEDDGDVFDQWLADLPDREIFLRGHFVADADVVERRAGAATLEMLLIEEN